MMPNTPDPILSSEASATKVMPWNVKVLGFTSLLNDTAGEMIYPLLPTFLITVLGGNKLTLGLIEGAAESVAGLLKLWSGGRSDQAGKRKVFVLFGYGMAVLTRPLIGLIIAPWQLFALRVTDRIGKGIRTAPRDALIADSTEPAMHGRAFGFHRSMDHLGAAIGPMIATVFLLIWPDSIRTLFCLTLVPGLMVLYVLVTKLREPVVEASPKEPLKLTLKPFDRPFKAYLLTLMVFTLGNSSDTFLLVRAGELGVPTAALPMLWCLFHIVKSLSNLYLGRAVDLFGARGFIIVGWMVYAAVYIGFGLATAAWHAWALFLCYAVFYGLTEPAEKSLVARLVGVQRKGLAYGWFNFAIGISTLPASMIFGAIYEYVGVIEAFSWGAAMAFVASLMLVFVVKPPVQTTQ